jgi:hypothetical protein
MRKLNLIAETLRRHLEYGGSLTDKVGQELVDKYASELFELKATQSVLLQYGLTKREVAMLFSACVARGLNGEDCNPCINTVPNAFPMLTANAIFANTNELENLLSRVRDILPANASNQVRLQMILEAAINKTYTIWLLVTAKNGEARFNVLKGGVGLPNSNAGCFGLIVFAALFLAGSLGFAAWIA